MSAPKAESSKVATRSLQLQASKMEKAQLEQVLLAKRADLEQIFLATQIVGLMNIILNALNNYLHAATMGLNCREFAQELKGSGLGVDVGAEASRTFMMTAMLDIRSAHQQIEAAFRALSKRSVHERLSGCESFQSLLEARRALHDGSVIHGSIIQKPTDKKGRPVAEGLPELPSEANVRVLQKATMVIVQASYVTRASGQRGWIGMGKDCTDLLKHGSSETSVDLNTVPLDEKPESKGPASPDWLKLFQAFDLSPGKCPDQGKDKCIGKPTDKDQGKGKGSGSVTGNEQGKEKCKEKQGKGKAKGKDNGEGKGKGTAA